MKLATQNVDEYISAFPIKTQEKLEALRNLVFKHAEYASEAISYGMPAYKLNGKPLIYFGGYTKHIGVYATPNAHNQFKKELSAYKQGKGSVQFRLDKLLPIELITAMIVFNIDRIENKEKK